MSENNYRIKTNSQKLTMLRKNSLAKFWSLGLMVCGISMLGCSENNSNQTLPSSDSSQAPKLSADLVYNEASMKPVDSGIQKKAILTFTDTIYHFGPIQEGEIASHDFEFTNTDGKTIKPVICMTPAARNSRRVTGREWPVRF